MDISLLNIDQTTRQVTLALSSKSVKGMSKLLQIVVLSLLNISGRDILDPAAGGGIPEMLGMNFDASDLGDILSELTRKVKKTESEILSNQIKLSLPADEKLRSIIIVSVSPGASIDEVSARIRILNEIGQQSDVVL